MIKKRPNITPPPYLITGITYSYFLNISVTGDSGSKSGRGDIKDLLPIAEQCQEVGFTGTPGKVRNGIFNGNSKEESAEERKVPVVH